MKTRDRIIHTALMLFNDSGEPNVTTNHIAASLGISPGNLYYHFRNKEQIIHSIFELYETDLRMGFQPSTGTSTSPDSLLNYFDVVFLLMWRYRFFYANLPDILRRDSILQKKYLEAQSQLLGNITQLMNSFTAAGLLDLDEDGIQTLAETLKLVASSWISYQTTQVAGAKITKAVIYKGVLQMLNIVRPLTTELGRSSVDVLRSHYIEQQQQAESKSDITESN